MVKWFSNNKQNVLAVFVIILLSFVFFWKYFLKGLIPFPSDFIVGTYFPWLDYKWGYSVGVPVKNPLLSDVPSVIYLLRDRAVDIYKTGSLPLWNSYSFCGYPLWANPQAAVLNPVNVLYVVFSKVNAWSLQVVLQSFLAFVFMFVYLKNLVKKTLPALFGSIAFSFGGFMTIFLQYNVHSYSILYLPLMFYFLDKYHLSRKLRWGAFLSLIIFFQLTSGYPQVTIYSLVAIGFYALFLKSFKLLLFFIVYSIIGLGLSGVILLPTFELLNYSQRIKEVSEYGLDYLPWQSLINLLAPDFFGNPATGNSWGLGNYTNFVGYTGLVTLVFALVAILRRKKEKNITFFLVVTCLSLLFALPTPIAQIFKNFNLFGLGAASMTRILFLFNFSVAVLASFGFLRMFEEKSEQRTDHLWKIPFLFLNIFVGLLMGLVITNKLMTPFQQFGYEELIGWVRNVNVAIKNLLLPIGISSLLIIIVYFRNFSRRLTIVFGVGSMMLVIFELFRFGWKYIPFSKKEFLYPETPVITFLNSQPKPFRVLGGNVIPMNMWASYGLESPAGYDAVYPLRYGEFLQAVTGGSGSELMISRYGDIQSFESTLLDLTNTKYLLSLKFTEKGRVSTEGNILYNYNLKKLKPVFEDKSVVVLENTVVMPRAFMVYSYQVETNKKQIMGLLSSTGFPLKEKIILEEDPGIPLKPGKVSRVEYSGKINGESSVIVDHEGEGFLFLSDSFYPGWKVFVDNKEVRLYRANYTFRAVFVPSGLHEIEFIYDPKSFKIGLAVSLISLLAIGGTILYDKKNKSIS